MNNPHNEEYVRLSHEMAMLLALAKLVESEYLPTDLSDLPKSIVACDNLAKSISEVPVASWIDMMAKLERMAKSRSIELERFIQVDRGTQNGHEEESKIVGGQESGQKAAPLPKGPGHTPGGKHQQQGRKNRGP